MSDPVSEFDLMAYVDGQMSPARRVEVEAHLARHPHLAAQVMEDLRWRDALRLEMTDGVAVADDQATRRLARQLWRRLSLRRLRAWRPAIAAGILLFTGAAGHAVLQSWSVGQAVAAVPIHADEAAEVHSTLMLEDRLGTRRPLADPEAIATIAGSEHGPVPLPAPRGWDLIGSDLVPWDGGSAVQLVYKNQRDERVMAFAAEVDAFENTPVATHTVDGLPVVHWQRGWHVYALIGDVPQESLLQMARH